MKDSLDCLRRIVSEGFLKLHTDLDKLRFEFKTEIDAVKLLIKDIEKSLNYTQGEVEDLKEHFEMETKEHSKEVVALKKKIANLEGRLKQEVENNIALEQYTRHKNLCFNNIEEKEHEDCKTVICNVLEEELGVDTTKIRFHAVHRVGKNIHGKRRPIVTRFVCREDREKVWSVRGKLKESITHADAYITEDYARAVQEERKVLIKAMMKTREEHGLSDKTKIQNIPGILVQLDFCKAFDTIEWSFIKRSLALFNFGDSIHQWISTFYNNLESAVLNNGFCTNFFKLSRGVRQGCPLSPYLFIVGVEILAFKIRQDKTIKEIPVLTKS